MSNKDSRDYGTAQPRVPWVAPSPASYQLTEEFKRGLNVQSAISAHADGAISAAELAFVLRYVCLAKAHPDLERFN